MNEIMQTGLKELKKYWYLPAMILLGIFLMTLGARGEVSASDVVAVNTSQVFVDETEYRLTEMLKGIDGAGVCKVTITLASGGKKEYVRENGNVLVISDKDGNESVVLSHENAPDIAGVTVACTGAENPEVRTRIIEAVSTVLGIGTNKICVVMLSG